MVIGCRCSGVDGSWLPVGSAIFQMTVEGVDRLKHSNVVVTSYRVRDSRSRHHDSLHVFLVVSCFLLLYVTSLVSQRRLFDNAHAARSINLLLAKTDKGGGSILNAG